MSAASVEIPSAPPRARSLSGSRTLDFWLLGGASIVVWLAIVLLHAFRGSSGTFGTFASSRIGMLSAASPLLLLIANHPHFMASYKIAYGRGPGYVRQHWFALIAVPLALLGALAYAYSAWGSGTAATGTAPWIGRAFAAIGLHSPVGASESPGRLVASLLIQLMWLTVGWHYSKQTYGCMMVYAAYDGYTLDETQRKITRWAGHAVWFAAYVFVNRHTNEYAIANVPYWGLGFPRWLLNLSILGVLVTSGLFLWRVVRHNARLGRRPPPSFLVPFVAFHVWWNPLFNQDEFVTVLVPFFHGLQYLPFVHKLDAATAEKRGWPVPVYATASFLVLVVAGSLAFELVPGFADRALATPVTMNAFFFVAAASIFINVHHYFIDSAIWRFRDPHVKDALLS